MSKTTHPPVSISVLTAFIFSKGKANMVIAYDSQERAALWTSGLHINRNMLCPQAPEHFTILAFGRMAINACRLDFQHIKLFAAGHGPLDQTNDNILIGCSTCHDHHQNRAF